MKSSNNARAGACPLSGGMFNQTSGEEQPHAKVIVWEIR
jgi:hypothetical protein